MYVYVYLRNILKEMKKPIMVFIILKNNKKPIEIVMDHCYSLIWMSAMTATNHRCKLTLAAVMKTITMTSAGNASGSLSCDRWLNRNYIL